MIRKYVDIRCESEYTTDIGTEGMWHAPQATHKRIEGGENTAYYCLDCEGVFDTPLQYTEYHNGVDVPGELFYVCPFCRSSDFVPAKKCDVCSDYIKDDYIITEDGQIICGNCYTSYNISDAE